jgi:hypothetical protein
VGALSIVLFWIQEPSTLWQVITGCREMVRRLK